VAVYLPFGFLCSQRHLLLIAFYADNEWNDCPNVNQGLSHWTTVFGDFDKHWDHNFQVIRPADRNENFAFVHKNSLFIGLNLVGGRVHHSGEWSSRLLDQFHWVEQLVASNVLGSSPKAGKVVVFGHANPTGDHSDFFDSLRDYIRDDLKNTIPFLYLNGDAHAFRHDTNFFSQSNFLRIQVEGGTGDPPIQVSVNTSIFFPLDISDVFSYDRMLDANHD
jgi:hypothetical protein